MPWARICRAHSASFCWGLTTRLGWKENLAEEREREDVGCLAVLVSNTTMDSFATRLAAGDERLQLRNRGTVQAAFVTHAHFSRASCRRGGELYGKGRKGCEATHALQCHCSGSSSDEDEVIACTASHHSTSSATCNRKCKLQSHTIAVREGYSCSEE